MKIKMSKLAVLEAKLLSLRATRDYVNNQIAELSKDIRQEILSPRDMKNVLFPIVRDFNVIVGEHVILDDLTFFDKEKFKWFLKADIWELLVVSGCFESKAQARKNWNGIKEIPTGYSEIGPIGKQKLMIFVWNPAE